MHTLRTMPGMEVDTPAAAAAAGPSTTAAQKKKQKGDPLVEGKDAPWVEKYRPKTLDDVAAHKEIIDTSELFAASSCTSTWSVKHWTRTPLSWTPP